MCRTKTKKLIEIVIGIVKLLTTDRNEDVKFSKEFLTYLLSNALHFACPCILYCTDII